MILLIADDVLGGQVAINGGGLPAKPGGVCYFAPDTLDWEDLEMGYTDFIWWALTGDLAKFYEGADGPTGNHPCLMNSSVRQAWRSLDAAEATGWLASR